MLILSRQRDQTIMIGDDIEITIVDIRGDKVRLGITAPRHIQVHRKEAYEAISRDANPDTWKRDDKGQITCPFCRWVAFGVDEAYQDYRHSPTCRIWLEMKRANEQDDGLCRRCNPPGCEDLSCNCAEGPKP